MITPNVLTPLQTVLLFTDRFGTSVSYDGGGRIYEDLSPDWMNIDARVICRALDRIIEQTALADGWDWFGVDAMINWPVTPVWMVTRAINTPQLAWFGPMQGWDWRFSCNS